MGKVISYQMVAFLAGTPGAARAVGNILAKNPFAFGTKTSRRHWVPCHRVVRSNGELGGFMGGYAHGNDKRDLLKKEGVEVKGKRIINFKDHNCLQLVV